MLTVCHWLRLGGGLVPVTGAKDGRVGGAGAGTGVDGGVGD